MSNPIINTPNNPWYPCTREAVQLSPFNLVGLIGSIALVVISILWMAQVIPISSSPKIIFSQAIDGSIGLLAGMGLFAFFLTDVVSPRFRQLLWKDETAHSSS